jgi:hypothetical protein
MSEEVNVSSSLQITKVDGSKTLLSYQSSPTSFIGSMSGTKGPVPGSIQATLAGVDIDFSQLTTPAYCRMMNYDADNFVEYGIWDPEGDTFYPLGEILPGESYVLRLSRNLQEEFGTGTGTSGPDTNRLRLKADTAPCNITIEAFED